MLVTGFSIVFVLASVAKRELELFVAEDEGTDPVKTKEAPAPISHGLRKLRLAGSKSSIDIQHLRSLTRNFTRVEVEPPSPVAGQFFH